MPALITIIYWKPRAVYFPARDGFKWNLKANKNLLTNQKLMLPFRFLGQLRRIKHVNGREVGTRTCRALGITWGRGKTNFLLSKQKLFVLSKRLFQDFLRANWKKDFSCVFSSLTNEKQKYFKLRKKSIRGKFHKLNWLPRKVLNEKVDTINCLPFVESQHVTLRFPARPPPPGQNIHQYSRQFFHKYTFGSCICALVISYRISFLNLISLKMFSPFSISVM